MGGGGGRVAETAKARARRATLLRDEDYRRLLEQPTVGDIAVELKKTSYASVLKNFSLETMHRAELEFLLDAAILEEGLAFRHYMGPDDRKLLNLWLENFDIELFKNHFRLQMKTGELEHADITRLFDLADFHLTLVDREKLFAGAAWRDILGSVKKESLRAALMEIIPEGYDMSGTEDGAAFQKMAFAMGMTLDRYYFDSLSTAAGAMGGSEGGMMKMLVGTRVDLMNLYWIYRGRRFFNMLPEEALTLVTKVRYHVDFQMLTRAAFADPAAFSSVLRDTPCGRVFDVEEKDAALRELQVEKNIYRALSMAVDRVFMSGSQGFQNIAAYLMLKEFEIRDLIAVIEAVRYGFDRGVTERALIRRLSDDVAHGTKSAINTKSGG
ncbi:MAG: V-type ATPase subunit [Synergistaceae bacterium]|jgi:V/A-type H+-transporting ATPase subunit C|nr:V-type ATPase subunit [Synergistaceae bacterium]